MELSQRFPEWTGKEQFQSPSPQIPIEMEMEQSLSLSPQEHQRRIPILCVGMELPQRFPQWMGKQEVQSLSPQIPIEMGMKQSLSLSYSFAYNLTKPFYPICKLHFFPSYFHKYTYNPFNTDAPPL